MKKTFLITQFPIADHFTLLVDELNDEKTCGVTSDVEKCIFNREIIDQIGLDLNFKTLIETSFSDKGITGVFSVGRFICVFVTDKSEEKQIMFFLDYLLRKEILREKNIGNFNETILQQFELVHSVLRSEMSEELDNVELQLFED
jgi:hypothetical protein